MDIVIESHYLPSVDYFIELREAKQVFIESNESFQKQTFRNRCQILTNQTTLNLTVPILKGRKHTPIKEVRIDYSESWVNQHTRSIITSYNKAPFFDYYWPLFEPVYRQKRPFLYDLNHDLLTICLKTLESTILLKETASFIKKGEYDLLSDKRDLLSPKNKTPLNWKYDYYQVFGNEFVSNLSVLDLLFCLGPESSVCVAQATKG